MTDPDRPQPGALAVVQDQAAGLVEEPCGPGERPLFTRHHGAGVVVIDERGVEADGGAERFRGAVFLVLRIIAPIVVGKRQRAHQQCGCFSVPAGCCGPQAGQCRGGMSHPDFLRAFRMVAQSWQFFGSLPWAAISASYAARDLGIVK